MNKDLLRVLACPKCKGSVTSDGRKLICEKCRLRYKIVNNVPRMLIDEAEKF